MSLPQITITPAGFAAIVNAEHDGTAPVRISHVGVTPQAFNVDTVGTAVPGEIKRISTFGGKAVAVDTLHLNIRDDSSDTYTLRGFGLYLSNGVLFAVYSQATPIMEKAAAATLLLATDIRFAKITATSIEVGDVDFINPPASTTIAGVARFATDDEAAAGSGNAVAMTPGGVAIYVDKRFGSGAPSDFFKGLMTKATAALLRAALGLKSAALKDDGIGNGLDADLLDGQQGAHYLEYKNITGLPTQWTPAPHTHPVSQVDGLQAALDGKVNKAGDTMTGTLNMLAAALRLSKTASTITLHDDAGRATNLPNIQILAGLNNPTDGHGVIINRVATGALALWARAGECRLTIGSEHNHNVMQGNFTVSNGAITVGQSATASLNLYDRTDSTSYWSNYMQGGVLNWWHNTKGNLMFLDPGGRLTAVSFGSGSSVALKEIEGELPYGLEEVRRVRTLVGKYKEDFSADQSRRLFIDADHLAGIMPEAVNAEMVEYNGQRHAGIMWEQTIPPLYNAVSQLAQIVDDLLERVARLQERSQ